MNNTQQSDLANWLRATWQPPKNDDKNKKKL